MIFPQKYKVLEQNTIEKGNYSIVPIRFQDRIEIMNWRNDQMFHLRQEIKLTRETQDSYFKKTVLELFLSETPSQLLFSYLKEGKLIGYGGLVHINWFDRNAEVSFIMESSLETKEFETHWSTYLSLLKKIAFTNLNFKSLYTYAYNLRPHLYPVLEKNNFKLKKHLINEVLVDEKKIDVFIHECINPSALLEVRVVKENDVNLIFNWSIDPLVRSQSFSSDLINFEEHEIWFKKKIINPNSLLLINEYDGNKIGLVRFEIENNKCTVGVLLDKNFRGKGLSSLMLIKSSNYYFSRFKLPIYANIKVSNIPSIRAFEKAGYKLLKKTIVNGINSLVYKLEKI